MIIKARKQGNSIILTIPKNLKVPVNTEFKAEKQRNGDILYRLVQKKDYNFWTDPAYDNYDYDQEIRREYKELGYNPREVIPRGRELPHE